MEQRGKPSVKQMNYWERLQNPQAGASAAPSAAPQYPVPQRPRPAPQPTGVHGSGAHDATALAGHMERMNPHLHHQHTPPLHAPQQAPPAQSRPTMPPVKEVRLYETHHERMEGSAREELFALFKVCEHLERVWRRGAITDAEYTSEMWKIINQYRSARDSMTGLDPLRFIEEYRLKVDSARHRLIMSGVPATVENAAQDPEEKASHAKTVETTQMFVTAIDAVNMAPKAPHLSTVEYLQPLITDLFGSLNRFRALQDSECRKILQRWVSKLAQRRAVDVLSVDDLKQLAVDLENSYTYFKHNM